MPEMFNLFDKIIVLEGDFAENFSVPVKYEPQSMHWSHEQVSIHSGITKANGEKTYHAYFSDDKVHDQVYVDLAFQEMLKEENVEMAEAIIITTDNCSVQYKSAAHFSKLQT